MKVNINTQPLVAQQLPSSYTVEIEGIEYTVENYPALTHLHYEHGWRDLITPEIDDTTEKLGGLIYDEDNDVVTYELIEKTQQEIEAEVIQNYEANKQAAITAYLEKQIQTEVEELDGAEALENQSIYPFWSGDGEAVVMGNKRNHFSTDGLEIWLWRCRQNHTTQPDWMPKDSPSLWERVEQDGEVLHYDPNRVYQIGERCSWQGKVYECIMANTTWSPTDYAPAWEFKYDLQ